MSDRIRQEPLILIGNIIKMSITIQNRTAAIILTHAFRTVCPGIAIGMLAACCTGILSHAKDGDAPVTCRSPGEIAVSPDHRNLYIAESTARQVDIFDTKTNTVTGTIPLSCDPGGVAVHADGSKLYVAGGSAEGIVEVIDLPSGTPETSIRVGHSPCSPLVTPDGGTLIVLNRFDDNLSIIDTALNRVVTTVPMLREPIAAAFSPDGSYLFVANHLPTGNQIEDFIADGGYMHVRGYHYTNTYASQGLIVMVDIAAQSIEAIIQLPEGSTILKGICVSPDGRYVYVTHILARYKQPTKSVEGGAINTNALSIIDVAAARLLGTVLLDDPGMGAANPWGITVSPDGARLYVAHAGSHEVSVIDRREMHRKLARTIEASAADSLMYDLSFMTGIRERIGLSGNGPRALVLAGTRLYVAEYFSDSLGLIERDNDGQPAVSSFPLGPWWEETAARLGERYFNDAELCHETWQSCASCHPDGRADGLTWDLLNDGEGNPKSTKSLLLSHATPPAMVTGVRASAEVAVRAGIQYILFNDEPERYAPYIDAYLASLRPVPSPHLDNGKLNDHAREGKRLFERAGCGACHPGPLYTDGKLYNAGTGIGDDRDSEFDTPTLVEIWRTAPFLYDGRAQTMYDLLTIYNRRNMHGVTTNLDPEELYDLREFILSQ